MDFKRNSSRRTKKLQNGSWYFDLALLCFLAGGGGGGGGVVVEKIKEDGTLAFGAPRVRLGKHDVH